MNQSSYCADDILDESFVLMNIVRSRTTSQMYNKEEFDTAAVNSYRQVTSKGTY